jgi:CO dehydrogenase/acetyl-CoA synthase delta subunit
VNDAIVQLQAHVRYRLGTRVTYAHAWRVDALSRLVLRHWPHAHLEDAVVAGGRNSIAVTHAMTLMRSQVREQWEARQGSGPLWDLVLGGTVTATGMILLDLWWPSPGWRSILVAMSRSLADDRQHGVDGVVDRPSQL